MTDYLKIAGPYLKLAEHICVDPLLKEPLLEGSKEFTTSSVKRNAFQELLEAPSRGVMNLQQLCLIEDKLKKLQLRSSDIMMLAAVWDDDAELGRVFRLLLDKVGHRERREDEAIQRDQGIHTRPAAFSRADCRDTPDR